MLLSIQDEDPKALVLSARLALAGKEYAKAITLYAAAIRAGGSGTELFYNAACACSLGGEPDKAFDYLEQALRAGFRRPEQLLADTDFIPLLKDPRWALITKKAKDAEAAYNREHSDPNGAKLITSDIALFWAAFDKAEQAPKEQRAEIYKKEYLANPNGSVGLRDFQLVRGITPKRLASYVEAHPKFFASVRSETLRAENQMREVRAIFANLKKIYPETIMPDTYICIGPFAGGGTVSSNGLLLSAEMIALSKQTALDELNPWEKSVMTDGSDLPPLIAHEAIHFQQKYATSENTLLRSCLQEGSADFVSHLAAGRMLVRTHAQHRWCNAHERQLWDEFQKEMNGSNIRNWLYSGSERGERPVDTGYYMGYKLSEAYYKHQKDKKQAIRDILQIADCKTFLAKSRYTEKFS
jgi:tetratricopeptide (TPR) repeat protein